MMKQRITCLKCGAKRIDDGSSKLTVALGIAICIAGFVAWAVAVPGIMRETWIEFLPPAHETVFIPLLISLGIIVMFEGIKRKNRVKCMECGLEWTPPSVNQVRRQGE